MRGKMIFMLWKDAVFPNSQSVPIGVYSTEAAAQVDRGMAIKSAELQNLDYTFYISAEELDPIWVDINSSLG